MTHHAALLPVTASAHPNIALVKYWGKAPGPFNRPAVPSLSITLDTLRTVTSVRSRPGPSDLVTWADGSEQPAASARLLAFVSRLRDIACARGVAAARGALELHTSNNFPMAAGLASSAAGFAAATVALARFWRLTDSAGELSALAREGSGSAARSLFGGFVALACGTRTDGSDAVARPLLAAEAWPLRVLVAIVSHARKAVGSTEGMQQTAATSPYWSAWVHEQAADMAAAEAALRARDFAGLAEVTERSCLKMHACALAGRPGLLYWQPTTLALLHAVRALRAQGLAACFTVDAGPQVKVLTLPEHEAAVHAALAAVPGVQQLIACGLGPGAQAEPGPWPAPAAGAATPAARPAAAPPPP